MKILNLYSGIGGNRKLWGGEHDITAVEYREDIANVYRYYFPNDTVIVYDAHEYLLDHYKEFDFIWASPPCPTHSRANFWASRGVTNRKHYLPDMTLYQTIIFLKHWFDGLWVVENVIPYYEPLDKQYREISRHLFWSNFTIPRISVPKLDINRGTCKEYKELLGIDISGFNIKSRNDQIYRNCVHPELGLHILNSALRKQPEQIGLFAKENN